MSFRVFSGVTFGSLLVPKAALGVVSEALKKSCNKRFGRNSGILRIRVGGPIICIGSVAVLGHSASWSLVRRQAGNWSRPALEARWRIPKYFKTYMKIMETFQNILFL